MTSFEAGIMQIEKIRDDILAWDESFGNHEQGLRLILLRCRQHSITLNKLKFHFAPPKIDYYGYNVY